MIPETQIQRPEPEQMATLNRIERFAFNIAHYFNSRRWMKSAAQFYLSTLGAGYVWFLSRKIIHVLGVDNVSSLKPPGGVVIASNHRSFYDQYVLSMILYRISSIQKRIYFPVKAEYFYQNFFGVMLNMAASAMAMYPPIFREPKKRAFNDYSIDCLERILRQQGSVVGMHPEGTRNKGPDPYKLLKAQPGIGKLVYSARPTVIPIFINGLRNEFLSQIMRNFVKDSEPIVVIFGKPLDLGTLYEKPAKLRTYKEVSDYILEEIKKLGETERHYREEIRDNPVKGPVFM